MCNTWDVNKENNKKVLKTTETTIVKNIVSFPKCNIYITPFTPRLSENHRRAGRKMYEPEMEDWLKTMSSRNVRTLALMKS